MNKYDKIAIFGGSFDPPHIAHEEIIIQAIDTLDIDTLLVIPTFLNPLKTDTKYSPNQRLNLMKEMTKKLSKVEVDDFEIQNNTPTTTYDTVQYLKEKYNPNKIYLIIGDDNLDIWDKWYKSDEILDMVDLVVASRDKKVSIDDNIQVLDINIDISSTRLRDNLDLKYIPKSIHKLL